jgi:hypothetical protein
LHVFLAHSGPCHRACVPRADASAVLQADSRPEGPDTDPADCPTCDQLIRTAAKPVVLGPALVWESESSLCHRHAPVESSLGVATLLFAAAPRAPPVS